MGNTFKAKPPFTNTSATNNNYTLGDNITPEENYYKIKEIQLYLEELEKRVAINDSKSSCSC